MWAAGVIFLSLISGSYPFFRSSDDMPALMEIIVIIGTDKIKRLAVKFGKRIRCNINKEPEDLCQLSEKLRRRRLEAYSLKIEDKDVEKCTVCGCFDFPINGCTCKPSHFEQGERIFPDSAYDLLNRLLDPDPDTRITAEHAFNHPFLADCDTIGSDLNEA